MPFDNPIIEVPVRHAAEVALIDDAMAILADPDRWTKRRLCRANGDGHYSYCLVGALVSVATGQKWLVRQMPPPANPFWNVQKRLDEITWATGNREMAHNFNDNEATTHADVIGLLRRARASYE